MIFARPLFCLTCVTLLTATFLPAAEPTTPKPIYNSQKPGEEPISPEEAARKITVPPGFQVTLFAGEPQVAQPIGMSVDDRGRLWVAECYTFAERGYDGELRDRISILHDTDGDGQHDVHTVFWNGGNRLTSVLPGTGGCWVLNQGALAWLADADGDDKADGEPVAVLDGFDQNQVGHNIVSGLIWGPDGWIYGRHGIQATSWVGLPGTPPSQRTAINCSIWRFHPEQQRFEVVTAGTTNPWGLDYNEQGEFFFTNNVIGHGWHVIPGAHYKRMFGADFNPHYYELIDQHADHYHWDHAASWTDSREDNGVHGKLGGGHSHCGGMIYLGDNWPDAYRNHLFMCNTHGRRVNQDVPVRTASGYTIQHGQDMIFANQPWFRGTELVYGPDGGVYLSDWTDLGECHDHDGVHRTSGRIYKITYGQPKVNFQADLGKLPSEKLALLHTQRNDWFVRHARRILTDRKLAGQDLAPSIAALQGMTGSEHPSTLRLRALWTLYSLGELSGEQIHSLLKENNEHLRVWAIRFLMDGPEVAAVDCDQLIALAQQEASPFVRLYLAAALQKMPATKRFALAEILCQQAGDADDHNIPLLLWYGMEPVVAGSPQASAQLMIRSKIPLIREFLARRLMHENENDPRVGQLLTTAFQQTKETDQQRDLLAGITAATKGLRQAKSLPEWTSLSQQLQASSDPQVVEMTRELSVVFGDGRAMEELRAIVEDTQAAPIDRINSLQVLISSRAEGTLDLLKKLIYDRVLNVTAITGMAAYDDAGIPALLLTRFPGFREEDVRQAAINTLCSRPEYARQLLQASQNNKLDGNTLSAAQARQIASLGVPELTAQLEQIWGSLQTTDAQKQARIEKLKQGLTPETLAQADLSNGRKLYDQTCAACHRLFDAGKEIGPTLTGSNRDNLDYLLENMIAPSAVVPKQYQMVTVLLESGRVLNGLVVSQTEQSLLLQTDKEQLTIDQQEVELIKPSTLSLMPEGQLDKLSPEQIRDLIAYLQSSRQVQP